MHKFIVKTILDMETILVYIGKETDICCLNKVLKILNWIKKFPTN